jgi:hypothetical protein
MRISKPPTAPPRVTEDEPERHDDGDGHRHRDEAGHQRSSSTPDKSGKDVATEFVGAEKM